MNQGGIKNLLDHLLRPGVGLIVTGLGLPLGVASGTLAAAGATAPSVPAALDAVACPTSTECVAVGGAGGVLISRTAGHTWSAVSVPTAHYLYGIACPSATQCVTVGDAGTVLVTKNAGKSWKREKSGVTTPLSAISCPLVRHCDAVGDDDLVLATSNGGHSWHHVFSQLGVMDGVACSSATQCSAVTSNTDTILVTSNGTTWTTAPAPFTALAALRPSNGVACSGLFCVAVADRGLLAHSEDGGANWTAVASGTAQNLYAASCSSTSRCVAVGAGGTVLTTSDGGATWIPHTAPTGETLLGLSCANAKHCVAVGSGGTVLTSASGGISWTVRAGVPTPRSTVEVLVVGDSFSGTLAEGLSRNAPAYGVSLINSSSDGCALARGSPILVSGHPFNLNAGHCAATGPGPEASYAASVAQLHPALSVMVLGPFDLSTRYIDGQWESPGQADYDTYFTQQVSLALQSLTSAGGRVMITTAPNIRTSKFTFCVPLPATSPDCPDERQRVKALDVAARQAAAGFAGKVSFVDLGRRISPQGGFTYTVDGVVVRAADGVHLSEPGGEWLTPWLLPQLLAATR
jgi:photosystem II stability/assembly factor-like uncharacterized protein